MLLALIVTLIAVNLGAVVLLYLQHRTAAREREATGRICGDIYTAADGAIRKSAALAEAATATQALLEQDRLEVLRMITALRALVRSLTEDVRGGAWH